MHEEASRPEAGLESILSSSEDIDEEDELSPSASLRFKSLHNRSPVVIGIEDVPPAEEEKREVAAELVAPPEQEREIFQTGAISESGITSQHESNFSQYKAAPPVTSVNQKEGTNSMDAPSGSPVVMKPSMGVSQQSPTTGLLSNKPAVTGIPHSLVSSPWSEEEVDYFEEDLNFGHEPPASNTSKFSHLSVEKMEVTSSAEIALPLVKITSTEGKLWLHCTSSRIFELHINVFLMSFIMTFSETCAIAVREASTSAAGVKNYLSSGNHIQSYCLQFLN